MSRSWSIFVFTQSGRVCPATGSSVNSDVLTCFKITKQRDAVRDFSSFACGDIAHVCGACCL